MKGWEKIHLLSSGYSSSTLKELLIQYNVAKFLVKMRKEIKRQSHERVIKDKEITTVMWKKEKRKGVKR